MSLDYTDLEILEHLDEDADTLVVSDNNSVTGTYLDLISSNLIYQLSSEYMRKAIGGFFFIKDNLDYNKSVFVGNILQVETEEDIRGLLMAIVDPVSDKISKIEANVARIFPIDESVALPNLKIPFRMYCDSENVPGDVFWREYFTGGNYGNSDFKNLHDIDNVYYDIAISLKTPIDYKVLRAYEYLGDDPGTDRSIFEAKCQYKDYNHYVQNYQDWTSALESELLIPNYNIVVDKFVSLSTSLTATDAELAIFARDRRISYTDAYNNVMEYNVVPGIDMLTAAKDEYYGSFFVNHRHSNELKQNVIRHQENIIFSHEYFKNYFGDSEFTEDFMPDWGLGSVGEVLDSAGLEMEKHASTFYSAQINFTRHKHADEAEPDRPRPEVENLTADSIDQPTMSYGKSLLTYVSGGPPVSPPPQPISSTPKLLEILKDIDEGNITDVPIRNQSFGYANNFMTVDTEGGLPSDIRPAADLPLDTIGLKSINWMQLLTYIYNNYDVAINDNYIFLGPQKSEYASTIAMDTLFRSKLSQDILAAINRSQEAMASYFQNLMTETLEGDGLAWSNQEEVFKKILSPTKKFQEVMAYKIEKIVGTPTSDGTTQNVIQKFWVYNDVHAPDVINIADSQVKYGQTYTYRISAYTLVMTHKYKYADYRLTKQIGSGQKLDPDDATEDPKFCLQFYNPATNERASQIFSKTLPEDDIHSSMLEYAKSAFSGESDFAVDQIDISLSPQLVDFNLYLEPCLELVEIPFAQKTVNIIDSPPNAINVVPFHFIDNSDRIGFKIGQDSFVQRPYPEIVTSTDLTTKAEYLRSRERVNYQNIVEPSQSPARYIEMYRIEKRPNAFTDFRDGLVSTMDLRIENSLYNYLDYITADQIVPNKKYYYVFRLLNENRIPGPLSQIIEAELTNDGGYIYSTFDKVDSSEFSPNKIQTKTKNAKKIFQLEPHLDQLAFDSQACDFTNTASEEVDNLQVGIAAQSIWDSKRFKIRLTSKKTGRKLDLNTGFNLRVKDLTEEEEESTIAATGDWEDTGDTGGGGDDGDTGGGDGGGELDEAPIGGDDTTPDPDTDPVVPPIPKGGDPSIYAMQGTSYFLYESQVHWINYGGPDEVSVWRKIYQIMASIDYGDPATSPTDEKYHALMTALGVWVYNNREVPADSLDNSMFADHLARLLTYYRDVPAGVTDWVGDYFETEEVAPPVPPLLGYIDPSFLEGGGAYEWTARTRDTIIAGMVSAGSTVS